MSQPYSNCKHYGEDRQPFNGSSQRECHRNCVRKHRLEYSRQTLKCIPVFIDHFISVNDFNINETQDLKFCSYYQNLEFERMKNQDNFDDGCIKYCPPDCQQITYLTDISRVKDRLLIPEERRKVIEWDRIQPSFAYIEEPVMSFTDYLVYCGGLVGLWFGTSAKDVLIYITDNTIWRYLLFIYRRTITTRVHNFQ